MKEESPWFCECEDERFAVARVPEPTDRRFCTACIARFCSSKVMPRKRRLRLSRILRMVFTASKVLFLRAMAATTDDRHIRVDCTFHAMYMLTWMPAGFKQLERRSRRSIALRQQPSAMEQPMIARRPSSGLPTILPQPVAKLDGWSDRPIYPGAHDSDRREDRFAAFRSLRAFAVCRCM
jgi:hypothetical protein